MLGGPIEQCLTTDLLLTEVSHSRSFALRETVGLRMTALWLDVAHQSCFGHSCHLSVHKEELGRWPLDHGTVHGLLKIDLVWWRRRLTPLAWFLWIVVRSLV